MIEIDENKIFFIMFNVCFFNYSRRIYVIFHPFLVLKMCVLTKVATAQHEEYLFEEPNLDI